MIEVLLQAERALAVGLVDQAERLYAQAAAADPRNSIAVVGLARVALERGDEPAAWRLARQALAIDPENVAAQRLAGRLEEIWAYRGTPLPAAAGDPGPAPGPVDVPRPAPDQPAPDRPAPDVPVVDPPNPPTDPAPARPERNVVDRLLRRNRP